MIEFEVAPDDEQAPFVETDNPEYSLERTGDAVAVCARTVFGIESLFPWQRLAIANILDAIHARQACDEKGEETGNADSDEKHSEVTDVSEEAFNDLFDEDGVERGEQIILLPTGAGKSLCFQVPALLLDLPTLIVYPLLALMADQCRSLRNAGLEPVLLRGGQTVEEREKQFARLEGRDGQEPAKLIITNPEMLQSESICRRIAKTGIGHLAIDEAHCVSEWGDSFRPSYLELGKAIKILKPTAITAFTATASPPVLRRVAEILFNGKAHIVRGDSDRPNISYYVKHCRVKLPALLSEIKSRKLPAVIFCSTRKRTEDVARFLRFSLSNKNIRFYHAGLERDEKDKIESWFHNHDSAILVTTCAWGMGVDKKNVRTVIHLNPPPTVEAYVQEAGRGGRDRNPSQAVLLWNEDDAKHIAELPKQQRLRAEVLRTYAESGRCRREVLLEALGEVRAVPLTDDVEAIACSGCDICDKTAIQYAKDERTILEFIKHSNRIFSQAELVEFLKHELTNWRATDLNQLVVKLKEDNKIIELKSFFWNKKLKVKNGFQ